MKMGRFQVVLLFCGVMAFSSFSQEDESDGGSDDVDPYGEVEMDSGNDTLDSESNEEIVPDEDYGNLEDSTSSIDSDIESDDSGIEDAGSKTQKSIVSEGTKRRKDSPKHEIVPVSPVKALSKDEVKKIQSALNKNGSKLIVDGNFGLKTKQELIAFQKRKKLKARGDLDSLTRKKLGLF